MWRGSSTGRSCRSASTARTRCGCGSSSRGVMQRFRTGGQWREVPAEFGAWATVHDRYRQGRDAGVFEPLLEGLIVEAAKRREVELLWSALTPPPPEVVGCQRQLHSRKSGVRWPAAARGVGIVRHQRGVGPRAQARAATSRVKAAMMTATRT
ncbi:transposase [Streptomyces sp. NPDC005506]|uniref:transposase n=1 Tax=unclassified Streptomyces TaxID=2593676 RepID=UPI0036B3CF0C